MIIYLETREIFLEHVRRNRIEEEVGERLKLITGHRVSPAVARNKRELIPRVRPGATATYWRTSTPPNRSTPLLCQVLGLAYGGLGFGAEEILQLRG